MTHNIEQHFQINPQTNGLIGTR